MWKNHNLLIIRLDLSLDDSLTWARPGFAFAFGRKAGGGSAEQAAGVEEAAAVLVGCRQRIGRVGRDGVMRGRLAVHRGQAAAERAAALHFHAVRQRHLVFDRLLLVHPGWGGCRGGWAGVWRHVFRGGRGEAVEVRAGVGRWGERRHGSRAGAAAARVAGAGGVQAGFAEVAYRPCVVVVGSGQGCFPWVQPGNTGAVDEVWTANLVPREASWTTKQALLIKAVLLRVTHINAILPNKCSELLKSDI